METKHDTVKNSLRQHPLIDSTKFLGVAAPVLGMPSGHHH